MTDAAATIQREKKRSAWIEWTRVIAIMGVVWFHADGPYRFLSPAAMIAFVIFGCAFIKRTESAAQFGTALRSRAERLLLPWLVWSVIYGALRCFEAYRNGEPLLNWWEPSMWLYGTWVHLWFLPMLFFVTVVVLLLDVSEAKTRKRLVEPFGWMLVAGSPIWVQFELMDLGKPFHQWSAVVTAVGIGILMRGIRPGAEGVWKRVGLILIVNTVALGVAALTMSTHTDYLLKHAMGALAIVAWIPLVKGSRVGVALGALTMTVYLAHPLIILVLARGVNLNISPAAFAALCIVASYIAAFGINMGIGVASRMLLRVRSMNPPTSLPREEAPAP